MPTRGIPSHPINATMTALEELLSIKHIRSSHLIFVAARVVSFHNLGRENMSSDPVCTE